MSGVDAAATLTLKIDTSSAANDLKVLKEQYEVLRTALGTKTSAGGLATVEAEVSNTSRQIKVLTTQIATLQAKLAAGSSTGGSSGIFANITKVGSAAQGVFEQLDRSVERSGHNLKVMLHSAEMAGNASIKAGEAQLKNLNSLKSAQAAVYTELLRGDEQRARAQAKLQELNALGTNASARAAELAAAKQLTQQMEAQAALRELNVTGTQAAARAAALAVEKQITKQLEDQAKWLALTDKQRSAATVQAAKALYGNADQSLLPGVAGSSQALTSAQNIGSVVAAEAALAKLTPRLRETADAQGHWNKVADEGHALARGLAGSLGTLWITYGSLVPLIAGAALGAAFKQTATAGSEFAYQLTFVKALGTETTETMARLSDAAKNLGQNSLQGPVELASGFRILAQAGLNGADSILAMSSVLDLAVVGEMDMAQAGTTLVGVMNAFGLSVTSASHVGDVFAKAAALSQTSVQAMTESMKTASVVSEQYGASLEDTATALTLLAKVNITGTAAGTSLRNMLKELYTPSKQAADIFKQLGISVADAQGKLKAFPEIIFELKDVLQGYDKVSQVNILQRMFGERGAKEAIAMLAETRDSWDKLNQSISSSSGFMRRVSSELEATTKGTFQQAMNALTTAFVSVFDKAEGPMKDMAIRLKTMFSSEEFRANVAATVALLGNVASATLSVVGAISTLINLLPDGSAGFALWVAGLTLLIPKVVSLGAAAATAISSLAGMGGAAAAGAATGLGAAGAAAAGAASVGFLPLAAAVGAVTAAYLLMNNSTPAAITNINALNSALDTEISRLKLVNTELTKKISLEAGNARLDSAAIRKEITEGKEKLKEYDAALAADLASKKSGQTTVIGDMLSSIFTTDQNKREGYAKVIEARTKRSELESKITKAELNLKIAEGYEDEIRINSSKAQVKDLLKQKELDDKLKTGTGKFVPTEKTKGGSGSTKVHDYRGDLEKSNIASLVQQEQENIRVLDLVHKNGLMSEEQYQSQLAGIYDVWGPRIEEEYSSSLARLKALRDAATGDEKLQYERKYSDLATAHRKFLFDEEYRSAESIMKEQGQIKKATDDFTRVVFEQVAATQQVKDRLSATRLKLGMTPEEGAGYDARKASEKTLDKPVADAEARVINLRNAGYSEESTAMVAAMRLMEDMIETRKRLGDEAATQAEAEMRYARSYEFGWEKAFRTWTDEGLNAAKTAADSFQVMTNSMENFLDNFLTTGKLGFEDFAKSVILSIAKIEAKALLASASKGLSGEGGGGFGGIIKGILGMLGVGGSSGGITGGTIPGVMTAGIAVGSAKGNVFSGSPSLHAYANTVQTTPQGFAFRNLHGFAKGGVFAESGPEAVMPLTRDSVGRLGVRAANDGNVINVTVNISGNPTAPDVRRAGGQVARETAAAIRSTLQFA